MKGYVSFALMGAFCLFASAKAVGEEASISAKAPGAEKKYGVYVGLGNPYPTLLGINAAYNISPDLRASIGYGQIDVTSSFSVSSSGEVSSQTLSAKTYGAGAEYLFLDTMIRPIVGLHVGYLQVSGEGTIDMNNLKRNSAFLYSNAGVDWTTQNGFQLAAGMNLALAGGSGAGFYVNSGYFF